MATKNDGPLGPKQKRLNLHRCVPYSEPERGRMSKGTLEPTYVRNGSVYVTRRELIERGEIVGPDCYGHIMPAERSVDINTEMDLDWAELLLERFA